MIAEPSSSSSSGSRLRIWLVQIGEELPCDEGPPRLLRTALLAAELVQRGHEVTFWNAGFNHQKKKRRPETGTKFAISQGYTFFTYGKNGNSSLTDSEKLAMISDRELQVMKYLGKGSTNQQISDLLHISNKTVATYKTRIFDKLGINNIADLILFCRMNNIIES